MVGGGSSSAIGADAPIGILDATASFLGQSADLMLHLVRLSPSLGHSARTTRRRAISRRNMRALAAFALFLVLLKVRPHPSTIEWLHLKSVSSFPAHARPLSLCSLCTYVQEQCSQHHLRARRHSLSPFQLIKEQLARSSRHRYARRRASVLEVCPTNLSLTVRFCVRRFIYHIDVFSSDVLNDSNISSPHLRQQ